MENLIKKIHTQITNVYERELGESCGNTIDNWLNAWYDTHSHLLKYFDDDLKLTKTIVYENKSINDDTFKTRIRNLLMGIMNCGGRVSDLSDKIRDMKQYIKNADGNLCYNYEYDELHHKKEAIFQQYLGTYDSYEIAQNINGKFYDNPKTKVKVRLLRLLNDYIKKEVTDKYSLDIANTNIKEIDSTLNEYLKPKVMEDTITISINPYDFIMCSENTNGWRSCFRIDGEYHSSTNALIRTRNSAIIYILDDNGNKKYRQWLFLDDMGFIKGKSYPDANTNRSKAITEYIKEKFYGGFSNWRLYNTDDWITYNNGFYKDTYSSFVHSAQVIEDIPKIVVPNGQDLYGNYSNGYISGERCDDCGEAVHPDYIWHTHSGESICEYCRDNYYHWCENIEEYVHESDDNVHYMEDSQYYIYDNGRFDYYWVEDLDCYYESTDYLIYCDDVGGWYSDSADVYYVEDLGEYYSDYGCLFQGEDGLWYSSVEAMEEAN